MRIEIKKKQEEINHPYVAIYEQQEQQKLYEERKKNQNLVLIRQTTYDRQAAILNAAPKTQNHQRYNEKRKPRPWKKGTK